MLFNLVLTLVVIIPSYFYFKYRRYKSQYAHIPGPPTRFFFGNYKEINKDAIHLTLFKWQKQYGPVYKIFTHVGVSVVCGDREGIHEVMFKRGMDFSGRNNHYREWHFFRGGGIGFFDSDDPRHKHLKNIGFRQLKPYGEGRRQMSSVVENVTKELWVKLEKLENVVFDPLDVILKTSMKTIIWFCLKEKIDDNHPLTKIIPSLVELTVRTISPLGHGEILDRYPLLRSIHPSKSIMDELDYYLDEFRDIMRQELNKEGTDTYAQALVKSRLNGKPLTEKDMMGALLEFCASGSISTSYSFYYFIAKIKKHPKIQEKMYDEIVSVLGEDGEVVTMEERSKFPYINAVLLESLRHHTVTKLSVPHKAIRDTQLKGYFIPKGTRVITNLYHIHYDPEVWGDPENFRPERFLDENCDLLPVDHPLRRHVVVFGAGPRVCMGEALATTRLFIWFVSLIQKYIVEDMDEHEVKNRNTILSRPLANAIRLVPRKTTTQSK